MQDNFKPVNCYIFETNIEKEINDFTQRIVIFKTPGILLILGFIFIPFFSIIYSIYTGTFLKYFTGIFVLTLPAVINPGFGILAFFWNIIYIFLVQGWYIENMQGNKDWKLVFQCHAKNEKEALEIFNYEKNKGPWS